MKINNVSIKSKESCCGCGNCALICPKSAIVMQSDGEGFLYPIVNEEFCINCGKCLVVCPFEISKKDVKPIEIVKCCSGYSNIRNEHLTTSSGGAATAIARKFIEGGGVVYGTAYSCDYKSIVIERVETLEGLERLKGSKYAQTVKGDVFNNVKDDLSDKKVLYIGLPCDIAALKKIIKDDTNLFTVELICSGITSQQAHRQFVEHIEAIHKKKITYFTYRNKDKGMSWPMIKAYSGKTLCFNKPWYASLAGYTFKTFMRYSCYKCLFKGIYNKADLTLGDFWGLHKNDSRYNANGVSAIIVHNTKGLEMIHSLENFILHDASYEEIKKGNPRLYSSLPQPNKRKIFGKVFAERGLVDACNECRSLKDKIKDFVKEMLVLITS